MCNCRLQTAEPLVTAIFSTCAIERVVLKKVWSYIIYIVFHPLCRKRSRRSESRGWWLPFHWSRCVCYWPFWWCFSSSWQHGRSVSPRARTAPALRRWRVPGWRWAVSSKCPQRRGWSEVCSPCFTALHHMDGSMERADRTYALVWMTNQWLILLLGKLLKLKPQRWTGTDHRLRDSHLISQAACWGQRTLWLWTSPWQTDEPKCHGAKIVWGPHVLERHCKACGHEEM